MVLSIGEPPGEFSTYVGIRAPHVPDEKHVEFDLQMAIWLSNALTCKVLIDGSQLGGSVDSSIMVFDGKLYLVDDCSSNFADGEGGPVHIIQERNLDFSHGLKLTADGTDLHG